MRDTGRCDSGIQQTRLGSPSWCCPISMDSAEMGRLALGTMYVNGRGVERDLAQAYSWFTIVARGGIRSMTSLALEVRDQIEQMMSSQQISEAEAVAAAWKPN